MYENLDLFRTASAMAQHAGRRQAIIARNVANADTPGYHSAQLASFQETYQAGLAAQVKVTRAGHLAPERLQPPVQTSPTGSEASPNGNTVSVDEEMLNAVAAGREHNRALTIYRHTMTVLRTALGRG